MAEELSFDRSIDVEYEVATAMAPGVRRVVARNPGPMTFLGTNTYLIGREEVAVIDPGPDDPVHRQAILDAAGPHRITHILLTHNHRDHSAGIALLQAATGAMTCGYGTVPPRFALPAAMGDPEAAPRAAFHPQVKLEDGAELAGRDWSVRAIHTPGHAPDHLCLELAGTGIVFSGDHVMGWSTSVIAPPEGWMSDYLASLEKLLGPDAPPAEMFFAGHGHVIRDPQRVLRSYLLHRRMREAMILACVKDGLERIPEITGRVYRGIAPEILSAARLSVFAHLEHLVEEELVSCDEALSLEARFRPAP